MKKKVFVVLLALTLSISGLVIVFGGEAAIMESEAADAVFDAGDGTIDSPFLIEDVWDLQDINLDLSASYALANNIDASITSEWNSGAGFEPLGDFEERFTGTFDGRNNTISGLFIYRPSASNVGLFGRVDFGGVIGYVSLDDLDVTGGQYYVGGLMGRSEGQVHNSSVTGQVTGENYVGGLIGGNSGGTVWRTGAECIVEGSSRTGGLVGTNTGTILESYAAGEVNGEGYSGGLIGYNNGGYTYDCYSRANVTRISGTSSYVGGFGGINYQAKMIDCYSTGSVIYQDAENPTDKGFVGGITTGGIYEMKGNFWDVDTSGQSDTSGEATGLGTLEMQTKSTYTDEDWDFDSIWYIRPDNTEYPVHMWEVSISYVITNIFELDLIRCDLNGDYVLGTDIDASETVGWNNGAGFEPIGRRSWENNKWVWRGFEGTLEGSNFTVSGLYINRPSRTYVGLFGLTYHTEVKNIGLVDNDITGYTYVGALIGYNFFTNVSNCYATGNVSGDHDYVGGLVGMIYGSEVLDSYVTGNVDGRWYVGGLAGFGSAEHRVSGCYATGETTGEWYIGGLIGNNGNGLVENSYATGVTTGHNTVGGFLGRNHDGMVNNSYASGDTTGASYVGGFLGHNLDGFLNNVYSTGDVTIVSGSLSPRIGGFVGNNSGSIINCYSTGLFTSEDDEEIDDKGFAGMVYTGGDHYEMLGNFWDVDTSGQTSTAGNATGKTTVEMKTQSTFTDAGWDFDNIWHMVEDVTYPLLQWQELPEAGSMVLDLYAYAESDGWNFVSINLELEDKSITAVLADIDGSYDRVMYYDAVSGEWKSYVPGRAERYNNLHSWGHTMGVWIRMSVDDTLTLEGYFPVSTDITLYPGWNMVGLPSETAGTGQTNGLPTEVTKVGYFDATTEYNLAYHYDPAIFEFQPGQGYLLYNSADEPVTWVVEY